jgi:murein L,D-transpeptidase YcbB/YkuD
VTVLRSECTGRWPVHFFRKIGIAAAVLTAAVPTCASASAATAAQSAPVRGQSVADFYRGRNDYPFWLAANAGDAADQFLTLLASSNIDGINPAKYNVPALRDAVAAARSGGKRKQVAEADHALSEAFVNYVADLRQDPGVGITYVDGVLRPSPPSPLAALLSAGIAPSLADYVHSMGWMHPYYAQLRDAIATHAYTTDEQASLLRINLERARVLPAGRQRYVLVNAAQQRLYMYENGKPVDSMVVVVGKPKWPTPMLAAYIRYAALNPYWYVPSDLAGEDVGQYVTKFGLKYLDDYGYEVVSDWTPNPNIIDPKTVDWKGVNAGKVEVMIRQKPGPKNFMGRMKFMFPNEFGVYLHDNPRRDLFLKSVRFFSGGCVRLEDAPRLGRWLFGRDLDWQSAGIEQPVPLAQPVPVYITYLTAMPDGTSIAYYDDAYGRDAPKLANATGVNADSSIAKP